jgi:ParB family transcriptional regulator, chromosome partitioning protein
MEIDENKAGKNKSRKLPLGRGLEALLSGNSIKTFEKSAEDSDDAIRETPGDIAISSIVASRIQPRSHFRPEEVTSLAASIKKNGVLQPILVRKTRQGQFELVCGERRYRAAKEAGLRKIPAVVLDINDRRALEFAMVENLQREDLDPIDEAQGYRTLHEKFGLNHEEIARVVGRERPTVTNTLRLLNLDPQAQQWIRERRLSAGHARVLLSLNSHQEQRTWAQEIIGRGLSVRHVEEEIYGPRRIHKQKKESKRKTESQPDPDIKRLTQSLEKALGTKVTLRTARKGGRIEIQYYSLDEFDRILSLLGVSS